MDKVSRLQALGIKYSTWEVTELFGEWRYYAIPAGQRIAFKGYRANEEEALEALLNHNH
jgi:hypothetical protein